MVGSLAGLPGRKAILYVSDGLQMIAGQDVYYAVQSKYGEQSTGLTEMLQYDTSRRFNELAAQRQRQPRHLLHDRRRRPAELLLDLGREPDGRRRACLVDSIQISNLQAPLQMLAEKTGGVAVINANIVMPHLEKIAQDFGSYYSLGYTPTHYGDGRYYKIDVKVKNRQGASWCATARATATRAPRSRMNDGTLAALNFPFEDNPFGVELEFGSPTRAPGRPLPGAGAGAIPIGKLVLVPREATHEARVRLFIAAMDAKGGTSRGRSRCSSRSACRPRSCRTALGKHYAYSVNLLMRRGEQKVAVGVRDDVAGEASFVSRAVRVAGGTSR